MAAKKKLTPRQSVFAREYLHDLNAAAAYRRAGYTARGNSAEVNAARLLRNAQVAETIESAMAKRSQRTEITQDRVLQELARIGFFDVRRAFTAEGTVRPLDELDDDTAAALVVEASQSTDGEGCTSYTRRIKFADKLRALELIGKHLGMFRDRLEVSGDAQNPLLLLINRIQTAGSSIKPVKEGNDEEYDRAA